MAATVAPPLKTDSDALPLPLAAMLVSLVAAAVAAAVDLVMLAMVMIGSGHRGMSVGAYPASAALAGAGFACAETAAVVFMWRRGRLHPLALVAVWVLGLLVVAPNAGVAGVGAAVVGGAIAIVLGNRPPRARASWRVLACLAAGACAFAGAAGAIAPVPAAPPRSPLPNSAPDRAPAPAATAVVTPAAATPSPAATPRSSAATPVVTPAAATPSPAAATPSPAAATPSPAAATPSPAAATPSPAATPPSSPATTPPSSPAVVAAPPADVVAATGVIRDYYAALDGERFVRAWRQLAPAVQRGFGGFEAWRAGYRTTLSSRPQEIRVAEAAGGLIVKLTLVATDRTRCGPATRRFAVRWQLTPSGTGWRATSLTATALDKAAACG